MKERDFPNNLFWFLFSSIFIVLFAIAIPFEHKYDKLFRFVSNTLIPEGLTLPHWFEKKIYFYFSDLAAIFLTFISLFRFRASLSHFFFSKGAYLLWIIFFCALISIATSPISSYPIPYLRLIQLLTPILLYSFFSQNFSSEESQKISRIFIIALFIAASFESLIAIAQYFHQAPLGLRILGEVNLSARFRHIDTNLWTLHHLFPRLANTNFILRAAGTLPHANVLGGFLCASLLASYSLIPRLKHRFLFSLAFILQFFAMQLSYSRSAIFGWILGTLVWFGFGIIREGIRAAKAHPSLRFLAVLIFFSMTFTTSLLYEQICSRGGIFNYNLLVKKSDAIRHEYQNIALKMIEEKPLTGVGFSQISLRVPEYLDADKDPNKFLGGPHNIYFFLAAETGLISLVAFLLFLIFLLKGAIQTSFSYELTSLLAVVISLLFIGACDLYPIVFQQGKLLLFIFCALLAAQIKQIGYHQLR